MAMALPIPRIHINLKISDLRGASVQTDLRPFEIRSRLAVPFSKVDDLGYTAVCRRPPRAIFSCEKARLNLDLGLAGRSRFPDCRKVACAVVGVQ